MRKLLTFELDLKDLLLSKKAVAVAISDETRDKRLQDLEGLFLILSKTLSRVEYATNGVFKLTIDSKQARMLKAIVPTLLYGVYNQLEKNDI